MRKTKYDAAFDVHLFDNRILKGNTDVVPGNQKVIRRKLAARRSKLEESGLAEEKFKRFLVAANFASEDATIMSTVLPINTGEANTITANNPSFFGLGGLTDGTITKPVASCCDGLPPDQIDLQIRKDLGRYIVPSTKTIAPCLPNFFTEGVFKDWDVAKRQGCYCAALGARGVYMLRSFVSPDPALDNKALTSLSQGGLAHCSSVAISYRNNYTIDRTFRQIRSTSNIHHLVTPIQVPLTAILGTFAMNFDWDSFSKGVRTLRNARDWAMEQREKLADAANAKSMALLVGIQVSCSAEDHYTVRDGQFPVFKYSRTLCI